MRGLTRHSQPINGHRGDISTTANHSGATETSDHRTAPRPPGITANHRTTTETSDQHRPSIPTTTPTIRCRRCCGDGRQLTDTYIGTRNGQPLYRLTPQDCTRCDGLGYLAYQPQRDDSRLSRPRPTRI